jgi:villin 1/advillin
MKLGRRARLFQLYHDGDTGALEIFQAKELCQADMDPRRVSIIDTFSEVYVYVGSGASPEAESEGVDAALGMVKHADDGRAAATPVVVVKEGKEPLRFRVLFKEWARRDPTQGELDAIALEEPEKQTFSYDRLTHPEYLPPTVDKTQLESYLSEDDFEKVFKMRRSEYVTLPEWKQNELRAINKLF